MRMGVQPCRASCWQVNRREEDALRGAARQGVRISRLCQAPKGFRLKPKKQRLLCAAFLELSESQVSDARLGGLAALRISDHDSYPSAPSSSPMIPLRARHVPCRTDARLLDALVYSRTPIPRRRLLPSSQKW